MLLKYKYKQRYLSQNNSVLKFRKASDKTTSSASYEILKNGVAENSKYLGRYAVGRDVSKDQEVKQKFSTSISLTRSRRH